MPIERSALLAHLNTALRPEQFSDYGPNGLQVEGSPTIHHLVSGVTASLALIEKAIALKADAILVHHGLFWRGQSACVTGWIRERLAKLLRHDINLFAYHLPLDAHPTLGNNAQLGQRLGWLKAESTIGHFGDQNLGWKTAIAPCSLEQLNAHIGKTLDHTTICIPPAEPRIIKTVAWCTGGAQSYFQAAIESGADVFVTGELSEPQTHLARESGVGYIACGHHASERYGAWALGDALAHDLDIEHTFIDIDNPA